MTPLPIPEGWVPEFKGQRPPFTPGNQVAVGNRGPMKHGAYSARFTEPIAKQVVKDLLAEPDLDWLHTPRFGDLLWAYARTVAQAQVLDQWMADQTMEVLTDSTDGKVSPLEFSRQLTGKAGGLAAKLGLVPDITADVRVEIDAARRTLQRRADRAQLQADLKADIAAQWFGGTP